eukprot:878794-Prymnesium_polylepis.1
MSKELLSSYVQPWLNATTAPQLQALIGKILIRVPTTGNLVQLREGFLHQPIKASPGATSRAAERNLSLLAVKVWLGKRYNESLGIMREDVD